MFAIVEMRPMPMASPSVLQHRLILKIGAIQLTTPKSQRDNPVRMETAMNSQLLIATHIVGCHARPNRRENQIDRSERHCASW
jgi:hypothetical protein